MNAPAPDLQVEPPMAVLCELTHRCPLKCPYCYNPENLVRKSSELSTDQWKQVLDQAAEEGVLQVHFSGGEPTARSDLEYLVTHATDLGLYANLITSGVLLDRARLEDLAERGLMHVQLGLQDHDPKRGDWVAGYDGAQEKKFQVANDIMRAGLALTLNAVTHRHNIDDIGLLIDKCVELGAQRMEIANVQYYGWGIKNRAALLPTRAQLDTMNDTVHERMERYQGIIVIDYVVPDYYAKRPKACMGGWGRRFINITPEGKALPCHAAETIPNMQFDNVVERTLGDIWQNGAAFQAYRGTAWMKEPCQSCDRKELDWGGCRCQALALTGDASRTDPVCGFSEDHEAIKAIANHDAKVSKKFEYREFK